jgi:MFS family permease
MRGAVKQTFVAEDNVAPVAPTGLRGFIAKFTVLKGAKRELWLTFLIKFLIYTAYSVTNKTMVLWLSKDLGFSDQAAGALVGWVWAPAMTVFTLLAGSVTDAIGLRRTFFIGVAICTVSRRSHLHAAFFRWQSAKRSGHRSYSQQPGATRPLLSGRSRSRSSIL